MWVYPDPYDVVVIGGGHAGCEAALAAARMGVSTLLLTTNLDTIGKMSCNPAIGGIAKGHLVREIDALGGYMGKATERAAIHKRMLNRSRGPAVWAPRAQCDRVVYQFDMKRRVELQTNLHVQQGSAEALVATGGEVQGVRTTEGIEYRAQILVLCSGTFMRGLLHYGESHQEGGRAGDKPSVGISADLEKLGFQLGRLKTGTPPRISGRTIDFQQTEEQPGERDVSFTFDPEALPALPQRSCYITYTTNATKEVIRQNIHRSPMYSGKIVGLGPRYCPSIEDKVMRFADRERHQVFLEPEGINTDEFYVNGISSSLPIDVQLQIVRSIPGLQQAKVMRWAYAVEYDYVESGQLLASLETQSISGLFLAGQVNGTSGYEEAAAQGLIAGINAAQKVLGRKPLLIGRSEGYIGVMIDDLITKGLDEPYRMFTSRAEHRLLLRQDNADLRLREKGYALGLIDEDQTQRLRAKAQTIETETKRLAGVFKQIDGKGVSLAQLLRRPGASYEALLQDYPGDMQDHGAEINAQIALELKYAGYLQRQEAEVARLSQFEGRKIPLDFDYAAVAGLRAEAVEKLSQRHPATLGQASRISGVSAADVSVLMVALKTWKEGPCTR